MPTRVPILTYHAIGRKRSAITVTPEEFAWQMRWLIEREFKVVSVSHLAKALENGSPLPRRTIVLTFDDGFASVYAEAFPILADCGFSATIFLVAGHCGGFNDWPGQPRRIPRFRLMTWEQVREMKDHGFEFGAHSVTHPLLDRIPHEQMVSEILESMATVEQQIGLPIETFAYPYGRHNEQIKAVVRSEFKAACSSKLGQVHRASDLFELHRVDVHYVRHPLLFRLLSQPGLSMYLASRRPLRRLAAAFLGRPWA